MSAHSLLNYYTKGKGKCKNDFHKFLDDDKIKRKSYQEVKKFRNYLWDKCSHYINNDYSDYDEYITQAYNNYLDLLQKERYREENPNWNEKGNVIPHERNEGGNKKIKTRRNKMKGRKSRKSRCNKNTKKRINKKKT